MKPEEIDAIVRQVFEDNKEDIMAVSGRMQRHDYYMEKLKERIPKEHHVEISDSFHRIGGSCNWKVIEK